MTKKSANDLNVIQADLYTWEKEHFPDTPEHPEYMVLGMCEEVGEISHLVLKSIQKIREGKDGLTDEVKDLIADGVYDTMVFGFQLLSAFGITIEPGFSKTVYETVLKRDWNKIRKGEKNETRKEC